MNKLDVLGEEIWQCTDAEARDLWKKHPADRWRIWTEDEVSAHMLDGPEALRKLIDRKKAKPGKLPMNGKAPAPSADNPYWCATYSIVCSEREECREDCCYKPIGGKREWK